MGSRMGTRLPMIFVKGQPARLHEMTLDQLRKFVPFLVRSVTKYDLPNSIDSLAERPPSWWPKDLEFSKAILHSKLPNKEQVKRLVNVVSTCYSQFNSSWLIAFSASLATKDGSKEFGKLTYAESNDGTTRLLNGQGQLVVVIRTATRFYDQVPKMTEERENRRRSARLQLAELNGEVQSKGKSLSSSIAQPKLMNPKLICKPVAVRLERCDKKKNRPALFVDVPKVVLNKESKEIQRSSCRLQQESASIKVVPVSRPAKRGIKRKKGAIYAPESFTCNKCSNEFEFFDSLTDHLVSCRNSESTNTIEKSAFMAMMGLVPTGSLPTISPQIADQPYIYPVATTSKGRPKRACQTIFSRTELGKFVRNQPILPLTSHRGRKLLQAHDAWNPSGPPAKALQNVNNDAYKHLSSRVMNAPKCPEPQVVTLKKHKIGEERYAHVYSYTQADRRVRRVELEIGLSTKSFKLLNKCKDCSVVLKRLPEKTVAHHLKLQAKTKADRRAAQVKSLGKRKPVVRLVDILDYPSTVHVKYRKILKAYIPYRYSQ